MKNYTSPRLEFIILLLTNVLTSSAEGPADGKVQDCY